RMDEFVEYSCSSNHWTKVLSSGQVVTHPVSFRVVHCSDNSILDTGIDHFDIVTRSQIGQIQLPVHQPFIEEPYLSAVLPRTFHCNKFGKLMPRNFFKELL